MKAYAGYSVAFGDFWNYYDGTVRTNYARDYGASFENAFRKSMADAGFQNGLNSDTVNMVWKHMTKLCNRSTTLMKSQGVPAAACTSFTKNFRKWFKSYYDA